MNSPLVGGWVGDHPKAVTAVLSVVGYVVVVGAFVVPSFQALFPELSLRQVNVLGSAIAAVNSVTVVLLCAGWYWIRTDQVKKHATAMISSFGLILIFLAMYVPRVAGGGTKEFVLESSYSWVPLFEWIVPAYLLMLAIHILLSILAVPLVLYALMLGLTHTPDQLRTETAHKRIGRIAAGTWILSLVLGVVTYVMLNHLYAWEFVAA